MDDAQLSIQTNVAGEIVFASTNEVREFMLVNSARVASMLGLICRDHEGEDALVVETLNAACDLAWQVQQAVDLIVSREKAPSDSPSSPTEPNVVPLRVAQADGQ